MKHNLQQEGRKNKYRSWGILLNLAALSAFVILTQGCASMFNSSSQEVAIVSTPPGAEVKIYDNDGQIEIITFTPTDVRLPRDYRGLRLVANKQGYRETEQIIEPHLSSYVYCNMLALYLFPIALLFDLALDAAYYYDDQISVNLDRNNSSAPYSSLYTSPYDTVFAAGDDDVGAASFHSNYGGTSIAFEGGYRGRVPVTMLLRPGIYRVKVVYRAYQPARKNERVVLIEIKPGRLQTFDLTPGAVLKPLAPPMFVPQPAAAPTPVPRPTDDSGEAENPFASPLDRQ
jgi:hypothetical protein